MVAVDGQDALAQTVVGASGQEAPIEALSSGREVELRDHEDVHCDHSHHTCKHPKNNLCDQY